MVPNDEYQLAAGAFLASGFLRMRLAIGMALLSEKRILSY
jgi:hypothetical protein